MFILITTQRSDDVGVVKPLPVAELPKKQAEEKPEGSSDRFKSAELTSEKKDPDPLKNPDPLRLIIEELLKSPFSDKAKEFLTQLLVIGPEKRAGLIEQKFGPEVAKLFQRTSYGSSNNKEQEQQDLLIILSLLGPVNPASAIAQINSTKWLPSLVGLASSILSELSSLGSWLAKKDAEKGKLDSAIALYYAQIGSTLSSNSMTSASISGNPVDQLRASTEVAVRVIKKKEEQLVLDKKIQEVETRLGSIDPLKRPRESVTLHCQLTDLKSVTKA